MFNSWMGAPKARLMPFGKAVLTTLVASIIAAPAPTQVPETPRAVVCKEPTSHSCLKQAQSALFPEEQILVFQLELPNGKTLTVDVHDGGMIRVLDREAGTKFGFLVGSSAGGAEVVVGQIHHLERGGEHFEFQSEAPVPVYGESVQYVSFGERSLGITLLGALQKDLVEPTPSLDALIPNARFESVPRGKLKLDLQRGTCCVECSGFVVCAARVSGCGGGASCSAGTST